MRRRLAGLRLSALPGRGSLPSAVAAIVGSLPGFTLPFVAALVLPAGQSDVLLLALSVGITPAIVVSSAVELTTVAEFGRLLGQARGPTSAALRSFHWRIVRFAVVLAALVVPALVLAYASRSPDRPTFLVLASAVAITPIVAAVASTLSGECVARGAPVVPIAVQAMRSLVPAVLLLVWPGAALVLFALMLPVGKGARAAGAQRDLSPPAAAADARAVRRPHALRSRRTVPVLRSDPARARGRPAVPLVGDRGRHLKLRDVGPADVRRVPILHDDVHLPPPCRVGTIARDG